MAERRKIGEKEYELLPYIVDYVKRNNLDKQDGLAIALLCNDDEKSEKMIKFMQENPDIEYYDLFLKAVEIHGIKLNI